MENSFINVISKEVLQNCSKSLGLWSLGISLYLELFCFLSFITFVLHNLCSKYTPVLTEGAKSFIFLMIPIWRCK